MRPFSILFVHMFLPSTPCSWCGCTFYLPGLFVQTNSPFPSWDVKHVIQLGIPSPPWVLLVQANPRLLPRVRLAHLRCSPQNMTSLVCHCTKCTHTQYAAVRYGWLYIPSFCLLIQYRKLFWKVLKNFAKYWEILPKVLRNNLKIFKRKLGKFWELLRKISRNIS